MEKNETNRIEDRGAQGSSKELLLKCGEETFSVRCNVGVDRLSVLATSLSSDKILQADVDIRALNHEVLAQTFEHDRQVISLDDGGVKSNVSHL
jgi:hypothetical protein